VKAGKREKTPGIPGDPGNVQAELKPQRNGTSRSRKGTAPENEKCSRREEENGGGRHAGGAAVREGAGRQAAVENLLEKREVVRENREFQVCVRECTPERT